MLFGAVAACLVYCVSRILFRMSLAMDVRCVTYSVRLAIDVRCATYSVKLAIDVRCATYSVRLSRYTSHNAHP